MTPLAALPLIDDDDATLDDDLGVQQIPVPIERIAVEDDDVRELARFERAPVIALVNERGGVRTHQLDDVLRREHHVDRLELVRESVLRQISRVGAESVDDARIPQRARVDGLLAGFTSIASAPDAFRPRLAVA